MSDPTGGSLRQLIDEHARQHPGAPAILAPGRATLAYGALSRQIAEVVSTLNALGLGRHDRVAVVMPDGPDMAVACLTVAAAASCAPLNPASRAAEFDSHLARLHCRALIVPVGSVSPAVSVARARGIPVIELIPVPDGEAGRFTLCGGHSTRPKRGVRSGPAEPDDVALVLETSGTASAPRIVPLTHANITAAARHIGAALELTPGDRCLSVMPLFHIHGLSAVFASMAAGASVVCPGPFDGHAFFQSMQAFAPTWYTAAPTIHREILDQAAQHPGAVAQSSLRFIRSASAAMPRPLIADLERTFRVPFVEAYGMTEAGPQIASNRLSPGGRKPGSVGRPAGPEVAIADGEVVIRGANVFVKDWFRTGDLGYVDGDGFLFITGRLKEIINRGGEKISPRELDDVLLDHGAVAQAVTFPVPHPTLGEDVAAAIVLRPEAAAAPRDEVVRDIRAFASARVAEFKVPQLLVVVNEIPADAGGKVRRLELAAQLGLLTPGQPLSPFVAPGTELEQRLAALWAPLLGVARVGVHDNFFLCGGDSLKATQLVSRLSRDFQIDLPANALFQHPTVSELAEAIAGQPAAARVEPAVPIPRRRVSEPCPLSFAQQRLWVLDQLDPGNPAYNMRVALRLSGTLSVDALEQSLGEILRRHDALRTTFRGVGGQPVQVVSPARALHLPVVDLSRLPAATREAEALRLASEDTSRPFHLAHGPLFRATLLKLAADAHVLLLTLHHIVSDGWSTGVLRRELDTLYAAFASGRPSPLAPLPLQYPDYAAWQREQLQGDALKRQLSYWTRQLDGMPPVLELPTDRSRPDMPTFRGASVAMTIPGDLTARVKALARREDATPFMVCLTAFQALLHRCTGQADFGVGTVIASRSRVETEGLVGLFANTLVMRADPAGNPSFRDALRRTRSTALEAYAHQDLPFEKLVEELHPERDHRHNPLFQVMFAYQNLPDHAPEPWPGVTVTPIDVAQPTAKFDLTVYLAETADGLSATWQYNTDLFDEPRIARMTGHFQTLLDAVVAAPESALSDLPLLTAAERHELLTAWNQTAVPAGDDRFVHQIVAAEAQAHPDALAVRCGDEELTSRDLVARANQLAWRLQQMGVGIETRVGILVTRSTGAAVAVLAVMKAGGTFVPLDPAYPAEHVSFVLADAKVSVVVTDELLEAPPGPGAVERTPAAVAGARPSNLAYVLYTSGSTGRPKGVMITHANLSHYVQAMRATLEITADDRYLHTASFAFSSSIRQLAVPLSCGASVIIARRDTIRDPQALFDLIKRERVSIIDLVPSHWRMCQQALAGMPPASLAPLLTNQLRLILSASEPLPSDLAREWTVAFRHGARLINMFGQTETTGIVTAYPIPAGGGAATRVVPIGRPVANTQAYVLDARRQPVPIGVWGELYIGGAGVGRGYLNDPDLTAERFVPDPFSGNPESRLYRTGDVVRYLPGGDLEFSGRVDHQMKVRGYRIEPGQIEAVIAHHPAWRESAVAAEDDVAGKRLVAYVVRSARGASSTRELRDFLKHKLPDYMVPARMIELSALPRTANGKVNWAALHAAAALDEGAAHQEFEAEALVPATGAEETLSAIWADLLGMSRINPDDNFFDIGGNSILAMAMITRAHEAGLRFTPRQLWMHQTIAELAAVAAPSRRAPAVAVEARERPARLRVTLDSLRAYGHEALERAGLDPAGAAVVTDVQLEASMRDQPTHNMVSIPRYATRISSGTINPRPIIRVEHETGVSAQVDGDNGPGQWVAVVAMETAIRIARDKGVGIVAVRRSNHLGAAGHYPWMAAREGLIGLCTTTGPVILAPTGGTTPTYGNNPIGVGIPAGCHHPILLDIAMSVAPRGRIGLALAEGKPLPPGWILDRNGQPSTDPADLVAGLGMPIGGHKGYGLTLIMEVLAGVLTGAGFGWDNRREHNRQMVKPANFGHFFMAIDPELFMPSADFTARVDRLIEMTKSGDKADGADEILVPGESELRARERSLKEGVPLRPSTYEALKKYGLKAGLDTELIVVS